MTSWVYAAIGAPRPEVTPTQLRILAESWRAGGELADQKLQDVTTAINDLGTKSSGAAVDAATGRLTNSESVQWLMAEVYGAASSFASAHGEAADTLESCLAELDAVAVEAEALINAITDLGNPGGAYQYQTVITEYWGYLSEIANAAAAEIDQIYDFEVAAHPLALHDASLVPEFGIMDPRTEHYWARLNTEERMLVVQQVFRQYLIDRGLDPDIPILWDRYTTGADTIAQVSRGLFSGEATQVVFNEDFLDDPVAILSTASHEAQHVYQYALSAEVNSLSADELRAIREGVALDPMAEHGYTVDQVLQWGAWRDVLGGEPYWTRPSEVDARAAGRDGGTTISHEQFLAHVDAALNPTSGQRETVRLPDPDRFDPLSLPYWPYPHY